MSAICGIYRPSGVPVARTEISGMLHRFSHCGDDAVQAWSDGAVGLGHRLLHTSSESLFEKLPLVRSLSGLAITADARIDNRSELIKALGLADRPSNQTPDSELILAAYERWGNRCVERLLGDFVFVIWDGRNQQLFCARDHFGVKPFFYHRSDGLFAFATEAKALFAIPDVPCTLNETRVGDFLTGTFEDKEITFFKNVFRLPPAHSLTVRPDGVQLRCYWQLDSGIEIRRSSDEEYAEEFLSIFTEALRCRLRSEFPLGVMLSGGLDSSSVACLARDLMSQTGQGKLHTFSAVFDGIPECNERSYIETVLRTEGFDPHFLHADLLSPYAAFDSVLEELGEPFHRLNITLQRSSYQIAAGAGVRVMLDGLGGDGVISHGTAFLWELAQTRRWAEFGEQLNGLARNFEWDRSKMMHSYVAPHLFETMKRGQWRALVSDYARIPFHMDCGIPQFYLEYGFRPLGRRLKRMFGKPSAPDNFTRGVDSIINPHFAQSISLEDRQRQIRALYPSGGKTERGSHYAQLTSGRTALTVEEFGRVASPFHVEVRYPHYDKRLVEFCFGLPPEQKLHQGWSRMILRRAMKGVIPEEIRWRGGKGDLLLPFHKTLRAFGRSHLEEAILRAPADSEKFVDLAALRVAYQQYQTGDDTGARLVWLGSVLIAWLQKSGFVSSGTEVSEASPVLCG